MATFAGITLSVFPEFATLSVVEDVLKFGAVTAVDLLFVLEFSVSAAVVELFAGSALFEFSISFAVSRFSVIAKVVTLSLLVELVEFSVVAAIERLLAVVGLTLSFSDEVVKISTGCVVFQTSLVVPL